MTWSRETNGSKVDILSADGDKGKKHTRDLDGRYSLLPNKSLVILRAAVSDAGRYFCNSEAAVQLSVLKYGNKVHKQTATNPHRSGKTADYDWWGTNMQSVMTDLTHGPSSIVEISHFINTMIYLSSSCSEPPETSSWLDVWKIQPPPPHYRHHHQHHPPRPLRVHWEVQVQQTR